MAEYAADTDGATVCVDCLHGACVSCGPCEAEACMCECNADAETIGQFSTADRPVPAQFLPSTGGE